ncbi:hypothetical protein J8V57_08115 [Xenorhabdus sp. PB61.4]|uniref:hypothetical protein n=1 Tax=Xenorhabdus sp. PB61.4 TaxID=2788940 RepID=UPI001E3A5A51|nr:hypothetical protein [Xenorhabdus sp. PB61.4]MCC8366249.1 hypothetical protein [Xenorhabdus sp. PB61.4]
MKFCIKSKRQCSVGAIRRDDIGAPLESQDLDFSTYYTQNCTVISSNYIMGVHIMFMGQQGESINENHETFLRLISYAFNKIAPRVKYFSKKVEEIKVYLEENRGSLQTRWPRIEDKALNQSVPWPETGPCLHINQNKIKKENSINSDSTRRGWSRKPVDNRTSFGKFGPLGVPDMVYEKMKSSHRSSFAPELSVKAVASIVHEIGHIIHAQCDKSESNIFWESKGSNSTNPGSAEKIRKKHTIHGDIARQVSSYVQDKNSTEFVAEVFTGLIYGEKYSDEVLKHYKYYHGPELTDIILPYLPDDWLPMTLRKL